MPSEPSALKIKIIKFNSNAPKNTFGTRRKGKCFFDMKNKKAENIFTIPIYIIYKLRLTIADKMQRDLRVTIDDFEDFEDFEDLAYAELKVEDLRLAPAIYIYDILSQSSTTIM